MSEFKDHFSQQSSGYSVYRPSYPQELFSYLATLCPGHKLAWDCGCGSGQAALALIRHFDRVIATDGSTAQIEKAVPAEGVEYRVATAESSRLADGSVDLILVAQALHWFEFDLFYEEVRRVSRPEAVLAAVTYGLMRINPEIDQVIDRLYFNLLGKYWPAERRHVDNGYTSVPFPFPSTPVKEFVMQAAWSLEHCLGYLATWSAVQQFRQATAECPVKMIEDELRAAWRNEVYVVTWPLQMLLGRVS